MDFVGLLVGLVILALALWILGLVLDLVLPQMGAPAQLKRIVLAIVGLAGLMALLGRSAGFYRVF